MRHLLIAVAFLTSPLCAQALKLDIHSRPGRLDSSYLNNPGGSEKILFKGRVHVATASWLRLYFETSNLPAGSRLRLTSKADAAVQYLDGASLSDYGFSSAYFNGDTVEVELIGGGRTRGNRVRIERIEWEVRDPKGPLSICGATDDRKPFKDARIGRGVANASLCTWWTINEFTILTAGHCASLRSNPLIGFNIPFSGSGGQVAHPPPDDQYPLDVASLRRLASGVGNDWAVVAALRNSNHGLYPGQKQGSWFKLGQVPAQTSGVNIRITGNGRVSAPISPTWNAITKTHVGPRIATNRANTLAYRTDTTGGNSGSPIIHEATGEAIGIHTHGGCSASGGQNYGTRIDRADLQAAIKSITSSKVAGSWNIFGKGCAGSQGTPKLMVSGIPDIGGKLRIDFQGFRSGQAGALLLGASKTAWAGLKLPLDLGRFGATGCTLFASGDDSILTGTGTGAGGIGFTLPNSNSLVGKRAYVQFTAIDPGVSRRLKISLTDAAEFHIGG